MKLRLETFPVSTNSMYSGRRILTRAARLNKDAMAWEARTQYHGEPLEGALAVRIALWRADNRRRDVDNIKALLDSFTGILWGDDSQIVDLHITKGLDVKKPRIDIEIKHAE